MSILKEVSDTQEEPEDGKKKQSTIAIGCGVLIIAAFAVCMAIVGSSDQDLSPAEQAAKDREDCIRTLSYGNNWYLEDQIKANLRDPTSYEFIDAVIREDSDGSILVNWEFVASNAFGGKVRNIAKAKVVDLSACAEFEPGSTVLISIE